MALTGALKQLRGIASELRQANVRKRKLLIFFCDISDRIWVDFK